MDNSCCHNQLKLSAAAECSGVGGGEEWVEQRHHRWLTSGADSQRKVGGAEAPPLAHIWSRQPEKGGWGSLWVGVWGGKYAHIRMYALYYVIRCTNSIMCVLVSL